MYKVVVGTGAAVRVDCSMEVYVPVSAVSELDREPVIVEMVFVRRCQPRLPSTTTVLVTVSGGSASESSIKLS